MEGEVFWVEEAGHLFHHSEAIQVVKQVVKAV
jgi:hypothetical protein